MDYDLLNQIINLESSKVVGKVMKRFEITNSTMVLKSEVKELIYEGFRDARDMLALASKGIEPRIFDFKSTKKGEASS